MPWLLDGHYPWHVRGYLLAFLHHHGEQIMSERSRGSQGPASEVPILVTTRVPDFGHLCVRFLGEISGFHSHYQKGKHPIYCREEECLPAIHRKIRADWHGYAAVEMYREAQGDWLPTVLELTNHLYAVFGNRRMRGSYWKLWREVGHKKKKQATGVLLDEVNPESLPPWFCVKQAVSRLYAVLDIRWGIEPALPPAEPVLPSQGPRPKFLGNPDPSEAKPGTPLPSFRRSFEERVRRESLHPTNNGSADEGNGSPNGDAASQE